ncbi:MAG: HD domain-containing protein [Magnetococcales bacterium]|nr:HD domain-containing protein [Magnetococcales bacterium]
MFWNRKQITEPKQQTPQQMAEALKQWHERLSNDMAQRKGQDGAHDAGHYRRVWHHCRELAMDHPQRDQINPVVLMAAAFLHDLVQIPKQDPRSKESAARSAQKASTYLRKLGFPKGQLPAVEHAIRAHSFSGGEQPRSLEAQILSDADKLDALGMVGLARTFHVSGQMGAGLFHPTDPFARHRQPDDKRYALDHFKTKLMRLPEAMLTPPGKRLAHKRVAVLSRYLRDLTKELDL